MVDNSVQNRRKVVFGALISLLDADDFQHPLKQEFLTHLRHFVDLDNEGVVNRMNSEAYDRMHAASMLAAYDHMQDMIKEVKKDWYLRAYLGGAEYWRRDREKFPGLPG